VANANRLIPSSVKRLLALLRGEWLFILDLDRTIFDTASLYADLTEMIEKTWGTSVATAMRKHEATSEHLDPFQYLQEHHDIDYGEATGEFTRFTAEKYPDGHSYLYPDVPQLLDYLRRRPRTTVRIVTTGTQLSQKFKLAQCPELKWIKPQIVSDNKGKLLEEAFQKAGAIFFDGQYFKYLVLIDDKNTALTPVTPHRRRLLIHLMRPGAKFAERSQRSDIREIPSLDQVPAIVQ
jgi:hypothetical protein